MKVTKCEELVECDYWRNCFWGRGLPEGAIWQVERARASCSFEHPIHRETLPRTCTAGCSFCFAFRSQLVVGKNDVDLQLKTGVWAFSLNSFSKSAFFFFVFFKRCVSQIALYLIMILKGISNFVIPDIVGLFGKWLRFYCWVILL